MDGKFKAENWNLTRILMKIFKGFRPESKASLRAANAQRAVGQMLVDVNNEDRLAPKVVSVMSVSIHIVVHKH